jgi:hypothetical protein
MGRVVRVAGWIGLVCSLALMVALSAVLVSHPRDERGYLAYVSRFGNYNGQRLDLPPRTALVAAGDRACAWLDHQQYALWRTDVSLRVDSLFRRYSHASSAADHALPRSVVPGAWAYLCPGSFYLHKPHHVFTRPDD